VDERRPQRAHLRRHHPPRPAVRPESLANTTLYEAFQNYQPKDKPNIRGRKPHEGASLRRLRRAQCSQELPPRPLRARQLLVLGKEGELYDISFTDPYLRDPQGFCYMFLLRKLPSARTPTLLIRASRILRCLRQTWYLFRSRHAPERDRGDLVRATPDGERLGRVQQYARRAAFGRGVARDRRRRLQSGSESRRICAENRVRRRAGCWRRRNGDHGAGRHGATSSPSISPPS